MSMRNPNGFIRPGYDPLQVADAPTEVTPTAGSEAASVDFTPPSNVGGAAVSEYYAVVNPGNITATSVTPPVAVSGLTNGTEYTTKVWANNSYGPSPYSAESSGFTPVPPNVEDVFSTYLYTGGANTATTINNGIDLAGEGGLVWIKARGLADGIYPADHSLIDTERGPTTALMSNRTNGNSAQEYSLGTNGTFNSNGFTIASTNNQVNNDDVTVGFASWTFRKQPKFFDVVTYTGNATARTIAHSLGSVPGMIIVKRTDSTANLDVYHRSLTSANYSLLLNLTGAQDETGYFANTTPTDTVFSISSNSVVNASGGTYVAYLFAHDAGGFGDDGEQNVISCGSYVGNGSSTGPVINLGYEPQWVLIKDTTSGVQDWILQDTMRGMTVTADVGAYVKPNTSSAEFATSYVTPQPTGFQINQTSGQVNTSGNTYIYIAIRRPMKTPKSGTEVFNPTAAASFDPYSVGFPTDLFLAAIRSGNAINFLASDRLRGSTKYLTTSSTGSEQTDGGGIAEFDLQNNFDQGLSSSSQIRYNFKRAPGFFDVVAYTGTSSVQNVAHNLGVPPELIIAKNRTGRPSSDGHWQVYDKFNTATNYMALNLNAQSNSFSGAWNNTEPTSSVFTLGTLNWVNVSGEPNVAYLFASCPGVSKVGSYTGTGADLNVDCGFSAGARFILIKRTDSAGDWYVWDSARGIVAGNDPYLLLNSTAAEVTSTDYIDPLSSGFTVTSSAPAAINASGGTYIFLAIA